MVNEGSGTKTAQTPGTSDQQVVIDATTGNVSLDPFTISKGRRNQVCWSINNPAYDFTVVFDESPFDHNQKQFDGQHPCSGPARGNAAEKYYPYKVIVKPKAAQEQQGTSEISHDPGGYVQN